MAQSGSAPGLGPGGRRFESCSPDQFYVVERAKTKVNFMEAYIYQPSKTAMQSGTAKTFRWVLKIISEEGIANNPAIDSLMGVRDLSFDTLTEAKTYAESHNIVYRIQPLRKKKKTRKLYDDNFRYNRIETWTH